MDALDSLEVVETVGFFIGVYALIGDLALAGFIAAPVNGPPCPLEILRITSKGFSTRGDGARILFSSKWLTIAACVLFIGSLTAYYYVVESGFNPVPQQTSLQGATICLPDKQSCPGFSLGNASLRLFNRTDIISQQVSFSVTSKELGPMARIDVYVDNVSLGEVAGPFASDAPKQVALGVPTTITVNPGSNYTVVVEGIFTDATGAPSAEYWQSISVSATGG